MSRRELPNFKVGFKLWFAVQAFWETEMSEEKQEQGITPESLTKLVERLGLPTIMIIAASYIGYNEILSPIASKYAEMLDAVTESNTKLTEITDDLRLKLTEVGVKNGQLMERLGEDAAAAKAMQRELSEKVDSLMAATRELSVRISSLPPPMRCSPSSN